MCGCSQWQRRWAGDGDTGVGGHSRDHSAETEGILATDRFAVRQRKSPEAALPADEELEKHTWAALYHAHVHHEAPEWTPTLPLSTSLNDEQRVGLRAINIMIRRASHTIPSKCVHTRCSVSGPFLPRLLGRRLSHLLTLQPNTPHQLASLNGRKALPSLLNKCNVASYQLMSTELCQANPPGTIDHISMVSNGLHAAHTGHVT